MRQVEEKVFEQEIELKIIKAVTLADQGCNHECVRELDNIMAINESRSSELKSTPGPASTDNYDKKAGNHDSNTSDQLL
jgi:hypothetical protein